MDCRLKKFKKYRSNIKKMNNLVSISEETNLKHLNYLANSVTIDENNKIVPTEISLKQNEVSRYFRKKYFKYFLIVTLIFIIILTILIILGVYIFKK